MAEFREIVVLIMETNIAKKEDKYRYEDVELHLWLEQKKE
jgi:hypothetical protein